MQEILEQLGVSLNDMQGDALTVTSPADGGILARLRTHSSTEIERMIAQSQTSFMTWKDVPAPKRGELIRLLGNVLREQKEPLAQLVSLECGKIIEEGRGEVQEMIDICDFAVGLSRQLYGLTIASERPQHTMEENWLPLGPVGIISAFNFPVAVWAWNFTLAIVCGDPCLWKPSEKTPLTAIACQHLFEQAYATYKHDHPDAPQHLSQLIVGLSDAGEQLVNDHRVKLVSATGSSRMGGIVGPQVAQRFGKCLLELGGNNAVIVSDKADLGLAIPSILFGAVGTCGQRCTTTRRLFVHHTQYEAVCEQLKQAYGSLAEKIGHPLAAGTLIGPLIDEAAFEAMQASLTNVKQEGGEVFYGERVKVEGAEEGVYVHPALVITKEQSKTVMAETFAPILYVMPYDELEEVMARHNAVPQGLSSAIFTTDLREATYFKRQSDCGIANVNIGTSGAEIGGAFGGEKETGGGRESGSDAWKNYMRRQTSTTYYGYERPELAQGIRFDAE